MYARYPHRVFARKDGSTADGALLSSRIPGTCGLMLWPHPYILKVASSVLATCLSCVDRFALVHVCQMLHYAPFAKLTSLQMHLVFPKLASTCGLVAMTSAQHAESRQFDPGQVYVL